MDKPRVKLSKAQRELIKAKFGGRCAYCGEPLATMHVDHLVPFAATHQHEGRDPNRMENLMPSCPSCNNFKMTYGLEQFRRDLEAQVTRARMYSVNFRFAERYGLIKAVDTKVLFHFEKMPTEKDTKQ